MTGRDIKCAGIVVTALCVVVVDDDHGVLRSGPGLGSLSVCLSPGLFQRPVTRIFFLYKVTSVKTLDSGERLEKQREGGVKGNGGTDGRLNRGEGQRSVVR